MSVLEPREAARRLPLVGRILFDTNVRTAWERDTATLPWPYRKLRRRYRAFAQSVLAPRALAADQDPTSVDVRALFLESGRHGFQTELLPRPFGTATYFSLAHSILFPSALKAEEFAAACAGLGLSLLAHELGIGPLFLSGDLRATFGWQRRIYEEIRRGVPAIAAFAITEPGAGSDVEETEGAARAKLSAHARRVEGGWVLNGRKCFISGGAVARWVTLFAAEEGRGVESWTCFLIDESMKGFTRGRRERKLGQKASDATELILDDVFVPDDRVIGKPGAGWAINRNVLNYSRPVVGAIALGTARAAFEHAAEFCNSTRLAGKPLVAYQDVRIRLGEMYLQIQAGRGLVWQAVRYRRPFQAAGSAAKVFCADMAWSVANAAMELLGDHGYVHGNHVEKAARDARLTQIYEGTNQVNRLAILEGQAGAEFAL